MGTDMTTFIEVYDDNEKEWKFVTKEMSVRNYSMFARIGGVRGCYCGNEEFHNRGLPRHMSETYETSCIRDEKKRKEACYHSITYYSAKDLLKTVIGYVDEDDEFPCEITFDMIMGDFECTGAWSIMLQALIKKKGPKNVRFIFAFDC